MDHADYAPHEYQYQTAPSPKLSNHDFLDRKILRKKIPKIGENTYDVLKEFNVEAADINEFFKVNAKL